MRSAILILRVLSGQCLLICRSYHSAVFGVAGVGIRITYSISTAASTGRLTSVMVALRNAESVKNLFYLQCHHWWWLGTVVGLFVVMTKVTLS